MIFFFIKITCWTLSVSRQTYSFISFVLICDDPLFHHPCVNIICHPLNECVNENVKVLSFFVISVWIQEIFCVNKEGYCEIVILSTLKMGDACQACLTRVPHATLIATIMCCLGVGVFCGTMYRGSALSILMFDEVFHFRLIWIEALQMIFIVGSACMAALGFMLLCLGCLTTGATRQKVYRAWRARVGGRISCAVFMIITYILTFVWIILLGFLVITTFLFTIFWKLCSKPQNIDLSTCIDFTQFDFMFPSSVRQEDLRICEAHKVKLFCKDYVEKAEFMFILAMVSCILVILSLVHYLMCLSANYAHIRDHEKFQELQELQYLTNPDLHASKDRF